MHRIGDALRRAEKTVRLRPERGQRTYRNVARVNHGTVCDVEEAGQHLIVDMGKALGGEESGPNPSMVLRSAISSCLAIGIKQWAAKRRVNLRRVEVALETDLDARGQLGVCDDIVPGFTEMRLSISIAAHAPRDVIDDVVATSIRYSPLMDVLFNPQNVTHNVTVVGDNAV